MSFYQICYTRVGEQERDAGWKVIASTMGISREASERCKAIVSSVIRRKKQWRVVPSEVFFIQSDDIYVYICNIVMECAGKDGRGNSFAHSYIIAQNEYYQRCMDAASVCGIRDSIFIRDISQIAEETLTRKEKLEHSKLNKDIIIKKYGIENCYKELMKCVFSILEKSDASLCIMSEITLNEQYRELIFCIMQGLPAALRPKLTFSTWGDCGTKIFFSRDIVSLEQEYFDLQTGKKRCDMERVERYSFIAQCIRDKECEEAWLETEVFLDKVFGNTGCLNVNNYVIEFLYQYHRKENAENAAEKLAAFWNARPEVCYETYQFIIYLLKQLQPEQISEHCMLTLFYLREKGECEAFNEAFDHMMKEKTVEETLEKTEEKVRQQSDWKRFMKHLVECLFKYLKFR